MKFTAEQIAGILEGEVVGNPNAEVFKLSKIEEGSEGSLTFFSQQMLFPQGLKGFDKLADFIMQFG